MKKIILIVSLLFLLPISVQAKANTSCDYTLLANLKSLASNINISYDYYIESNEAYFNVTINNITPDIYIVDNVTNVIYNYQNTSAGEVIINNYKDVTKLQYSVYSSDNNCNGELLSTLYITLPTYNQYSSNPVCDDIKDYSLCQRWNPFNGTHEDFITRVNNYKNSKVVEEDPIEEEKKDITTLLDKLGTLYSKYYIVLYVIIILPSIIIIYRHNKKSKFDFKV